MLGTKLRNHGFAVVLAHDAVQAVKSAAKARPDAIVLDVKMPGGTGIEAIRQLKISERTSAIPVIAVSAVDNPQLPKVLKGLGASEFIPKPVHFQTIHRVLRTMIDPGPDPAPAA